MNSFIYHQMDVYILGRSNSRIDSYIRDFLPQAMPVQIFAKDKQEFWHINEE